MTRALVFADQHVGKTHALDVHERVLAQIAETAVERNVDLVLFCGDLYEGPTTPASHFHAVRRALTELDRHGIPVIAVHGNGRHDQVGSQGEENALAVHDNGETFIVATRPTIETHPAADIAVACLPWAPPNRVRAALNGSSPDDADATTAQLILHIARNLHAEARRDHPGLPVVLISHYATTGWKTPAGLPTDELRDIVLDVDELAGIGYDAVWCGHIHCGGLIVPGVWSCGSPLALDHSEGGYQHGVWIWEDGAGEFVPIDGPRFVTLDVGPLTDAWEDALPAFESNPILDGAIVRLKYDAREDQRVDHALIAAALEAAGATVDRIDGHVERATRARAGHVTGMLAPEAAFDAWLDAAGVDEWLRVGLRERAALQLRRAA